MNFSANYNAFYVWGNTRV